MKLKFLQPLMMVPTENVSEHTVPHGLKHTGLLNPRPVRVPMLTSVYSQKQCVCEVAELDQRAMEQDGQVRGITFFYIVDGWVSVF